MREIFLLFGFSALGVVMLAQMPASDPATDPAWPAPLRTRPAKDKLVTNRVVVVTEAGSTVSKVVDRTLPRVTNYTDVGGFVAATNRAARMTNAQPMEVRGIIQSEEIVPGVKPAQRSKMNVTSANPTNEPKSVHTVRGKISADEPGQGDAAPPATNKLTDVDPLPE